MAFLSSRVSPVPPPPPLPSSSTPCQKFEVFLSFCGKDTRLNFTDHLYKALKGKGIDVFRDDEEIERGEDISQELLDAIKGSQFAIIVLSKNYAFSKWCLAELSEIVKCRKKRQTVFPVFYHVDPSDVRNQTGSFANAFDEHREDPKVDEQKRKMWTDALKEVGNIAGCHVKDRHDTTVIEEIIDWVFGKLTRNLPNVSTKLVGMESRVKEITTLLRSGGGGVRFIGFHGMGGVGKTTLAEAVFHRVSSEFDASCFIACDGETGKRDLVSLQKELIFKTLMERKLKIYNPSEGIRLIKARLQKVKVLIVVDNVDHKVQLESLVGEVQHKSSGESYWFGQGSRIIIASRDRGLLSGLVHDLYEVNGLNINEALEVFSWHAFGKPCPDGDYVTLSEDFVKYTQCLPLALKVLGSFLYGREMYAWKDTLQKLQLSPNPEILDVLKRSFDGLDDLLQQLFLDIACFFNGAHICNIIYRLESFGYSITDIDVLVEKSLISKSMEKVWMHDLLRDMGKHLVQSKSLRKLGGYSRLWDSNDIIRVLKSNIGTDAIEAIVLKLPLHKEEPLSVEAFSKMNGLRMLEISNVDSTISFSRSRDHLRFLKWHGTTSNFMLSNELCVLEWWGYPLESLLPSFQPDNLVELIMRQSHIKKLWDGQKSFEKLKHIDLIDSQSLVELPDFGGIPHIVELELAHCTSLCKVHESIGFLKKLKRLDLRGCVNLKRLVDAISLESLEDLNLSGCSMLNEFPNVVGNMTSLKLLDLTGTVIMELPSSFKRLSGLVHFSVSHCLRFKEIPESLSGMECLECLYAQGTSIMVLPTYVLSLEKHKVLKVGGSDSNTLSFVLPKLFFGLSSLRELDLSYRNLFDRSMPDDLSCLSSLESLNLSGNKITVIPNLCLGLSPLRKLHISYCNLLDGALPNDLSSLPSLWLLDLSGNKFKKIPDSICQLFDLRELYLEDCCQLELLPKLPLRLGYLYVKNCLSLTTFHNKLDAFASSDTLSAIDFSFVAVYIDYDGKPYKTVHLHQQSPLWIKSKAESFDTLVACGLKFAKTIHQQHGFLWAESNPEIFDTLVACGLTKKNRIINLLVESRTKCLLHLDLELELDLELDLDEDLEGWKGYALFIVFLVSGQEGHDQNSSNPGISDGINPTFPYFLCQFQTDNVILREPLVLCIPEVPSVGRNEFWAYIPAEWFGEQGINLDEWSDLKASVEIISLNMNIVRYGLHPIRQHDLQEFYNVIHAIAQRGFSLGNWNNLLSCLYKDFKSLKVQGPIHGTVTNS